MCAGGSGARERALRLREQGRRQPRALTLMSPGTTRPASGPSYPERADIDPMLTMEYIESVRAAYCGERTDFDNPCFSPLLADLRADFLATQAQCREMRLGGNVRVGFGRFLVDGVLRVLSPLC